MPDILRQFRAFDLFAFTFSSTITLGVAFLPFVSGGIVRNAWLQLTLTSLPYFMLVWLIYRFTLKYSDYDFFSALHTHLWKGLYWFIMLYFILSSLLGVAKSVNDLNALTRTFLLHNSPKWSVVLFFLIVVGVAVYYGILAITRFLVIFIAVFLLIISVVIITGFQDPFQLLFIPPLWSSDLLSFMKSSVSELARYGGIVALLGFIMYMKENEKVLKPMNFALLLIMVIYVLLCISIVGTFGFEQAVSLVSPATSLAQTITTEGGLAERLDLFFLIFWIIAFFQIVTIHLWFAVFLARKCWSKCPNSILIIIFLGMIYFSNLFIPISYDLGWQIHNYNVIIYGLLLPFCLLIFLLLKKNKSKEQPNS